MATKVRWMLGILTTVVFLWLGATMLSIEPRVGALLLAFGVLRGSLVARQIWNEVAAERAANEGTPEEHQP
jgi:hypothetical protein